MALKDMFSAMKNEGYVIKDLDFYLLKLNDEDSGRAIDVNAPSQAGTCMKARYLARTGAETDGGAVDARLRRIFDNGTGMHERIQAYLIAQGMLLMDEIPVHHTELNIQGHTDGLLNLKTEYAVLELKSMNTNNFSKLKDAKEEHKMQGLVYVFCIEERRLALHKKYPTRVKFLMSKSVRMKQYAKLYTHIKSGKKYTREEKVQHQCELHDKMDNILMTIKKPITKTVFVYEDKNDQNLKEFIVDIKDSASQVIIQGVLDEYRMLNQFIKDEVCPPRCAKNKSDNACRWCNYKSLCWIV